MNHPNNHYDHPNTTNHGNHHITTKHAKNYGHDHGNHNQRVHHTGLGDTWIAQGSCLRLQLDALAPWRLVGLSGSCAMLSKLNIVLSKSDDHNKWVLI